MLNWFSSLDFAWMAWTWQIAVFFVLIAVVLLIMTFLAVRYPETPRTGILHIETTRGDRLFISLLGSAFICLFWLGIAQLIVGKDVNLWWAVGLCVVYATAVFRFV